jgi:hypothetical protein
VISSTQLGGEMGETFFGIFVVLALGLTIFVVVTIERGKQRQLAAMSPEARQNLSNAQAHGPLNPAMICPHCQTLGQIRTKPIVLKKGVSGGKATAAVFTAGVSLVATGLSRKENLTEAWCGNCANKWVF